MKKYVKEKGDDLSKWSVQGALTPGEHVAILKKQTLQASGFIDATFITEEGKEYITSINYADFLEVTGGKALVEDMKYKLTISLSPGMAVVRTSAGFNIVHYPDGGMEFEIPIDMEQLIEYTKINPITPAVPYLSKVEELDALRIPKE